MIAMELSTSLPQLSNRPSILRPSQRQQILLSLHVSHSRKSLLLPWLPSIISLEFSSTSIIVIYLNFQLLQVSQVLTH